MENDISETSELLNEVGICRYLLENKSYKTAWKFIRKIEAKCLKSKDYTVQNVLYTLMLEYADTQYAIDFDRILEGKTNAKMYLDQEDALLIALTKIKQKLISHKNQTSDVNANVADLEALIASNKLNIYQHPKQVCNYLEALRTTLLINRNVAALEKTIVSIYKRLTDENAFSKHSHQYKLRILYMLCHALYRNKKICTLPAVSNSV